MTTNFAWLATKTIKSPCDPSIGYTKQDKIHEIFLFFLVFYYLNKRRRHKFLPLCDVKLFGNIHALFICAPHQTPTHPCNIFCGGTALKTLSKVSMLGFVRQICPIFE